MPEIRLPLEERRTVWLSKGGTAEVERGTIMTVTPAVVRQENGYEDFIKLDHHLHDSSAGPLFFTTVVDPCFIWAQVFLTPVAVSPGLTRSYYTQAVAKLPFVRCRLYEDMRHTHGLLIVLSENRTVLCQVYEKHLSGELQMEFVVSNADSFFMVRVSGLNGMTRSSGVSFTSDLYFAFPWQTLLLRNHLFESCYRGASGIDRCEYRPRPATAPVFFDTLQ